MPTKYDAVSKDGKLKPWTSHDDETLDHFKARIRTDGLDPSQYEFKQQSQDADNNEILSLLRQILEKVSVTPRVIEKPNVPPDETVDEE